MPSEVSKWLMNEYYSGWVGEVRGFYDSTVWSLESGVYLSAIVFSWILFVLLIVVSGLEV